MRARWAARGCVFTEMTCVAPDARITPGCAGLWSDEPGAAWTRIVDFVHHSSSAKIGLQLGHAGPKGSTQLGWEEIDEPLREGNWPLIAPSAIAYGPREPDTARDDARRHGRGARAVRARGESAAHNAGSTSWSCIAPTAICCPASSARSPTGAPTSTVVRWRIALRYPLEVFRAVREVWPKDKPMSVRISAHDWAPGGNTPDDAVEIARMFKAAGADLIDVSSGQTTRLARPVYGRMYQTPFSDRIRNEVGIGTIAVGNIFEPDHVNSIIAAGRADLCALARPHLADPRGHCTRLRN